jgi:A/G-specific adenine glycosylase
MVGEAFSKAVWFFSYFWYATSMKPDALNLTAAAAEFRATYATEGMNTSLQESFREYIGSYYQANRRDFPWRQTHDPYQILISEIMLQQTQAERVVPKYQEFLVIFPTVEALATAETATLLGVWQGLGYNRRALNLRRAAQRIVGEYSGRLPQETKRLQDLAGIGPYTCAAIRAFAFEKPDVVIETNIRRLYIYFFFDPECVVHDKEVLPLIEATMDTESPREWYYALMDFGSMLAKVIPNPNRRSRHYARQTTFQGSNRQLRGNILKRLLQTGAAGNVELADSLQVEYSRLRETLVQLQTEGFVAVEEDTARLVR